MLLSAIENADSLSKVITGAVESKFLDKLTHKRLPEDSLYLPEREQIEGAMIGKLAGKSTEVNDYADRVVANVLRASPQKHQWTGKLTTGLWILHAFFWSTVWVCRPSDLADWG